MLYVIVILAVLWFLKKGLRWLVVVGLIWFLFSVVSELIMSRLNNLLEVFM